MLLYADDTQLVVTLAPNLVLAASSFADCLKDLASWMTGNCLKLNGNKTEILIVGNTPSIWSSTWWPAILGPVSTPKTEVKNLRVWIDATLSFETHIKKVAGRCFGIQKTLRKTIDILPMSARKTLTHALVTARLDYGNVLYLGATKKGTP